VQALQGLKELAPESKKEEVDKMIKVINSDYGKDYEQM